MKVWNFNAFESSITKFSKLNWIFFNYYLILNLIHFSEKLGTQQQQGPDIGSILAAHHKATHLSGLGVGAPGINVVNTGLIGKPMQHRLVVGMTDKSGNLFRRKVRFLWFELILYP